MSTTLTAGTWTMPVTVLGPDNPLPAFRPLAELPAIDDVAGLPDDLVAGMRYGRLESPLPYGVQDDYSRQQEPTEVRTLVLDNGILRATVLPEWGGRLWSLRHLPSDRELLHVPDSIRLANLALRGAWFAGGVEWNLGSTGHTTLTCAPLFAARVETAEGDPVLRLWEWERTRDLVQQIDLRLPPGSSFLQVSVRVVNPDEDEKPLYWWSNMAVPQTTSGRVLAPARSAFRSGYTGSLEIVGVPEHDGADVTRPGRAPKAADYFFDIPSDRRRWICSVDEAGVGLVHTSTHNLRGRKLFCWGTSSGGRHWQDWLGDTTGDGYAEIQAGLARTQLEHLRLAAGGRVEWTEFYGLADVEPARAQSTDWNEALRAVESASLLSDDDVSTAHERWLGDVADSAPVELLHEGSGWGAAEMGIRGAQPQAATPFPVAAPEPFAILLSDGTLPEHDPSEPPPLPPVSARWAARYADAADWLGLLYLGIAHRHAGDDEGAVAAWQSSLEVRESAWALRNLADLRRGSAPDQAADLLLRALRLAPGCLPLRAEAAAALLAAGRAEEAPVLCSERFGQLRLQLLIAQCRLAEAGELFEHGIDVADVREGSDALTQAWAAVHPDTPLPARYDFRMK